jgi:HPt (histidine-containing phosphotransfer) domain-containing protein
MGYKIKGILGLLQRGGALGCAQIKAKEKLMKVSEELKKKYMDRRIEEISLLFKSIEQGDFAPALKLGHQVKGNASTFDIPQISPLGSEIEKAAIKQDKELVTSLLNKMWMEIKFISGGYIQ